MTIAGTFPDHGFRVQLTRQALEAGGARYHGDAFVPGARFPLELSVSAEGGVTLVVGAPVGPDGAAASAALAPADEAFVRQLGKQLHRQATELPEEQGGGQWARRVQRWRGPK